MPHKIARPKVASIRLGTFVLLIILVAVAFGGAGFLYGRKASLTKSTATTSTTATADTTGWKTYTNDKYGFSFKYPTSDGWRVFNNDAERNVPENEISSFRLANYDFKYDPGYGLQDDEAIIYITVDKTNETMEQAVQNSKSPQEQVTDINGLKFLIDEPGEIKAGETLEGDFSDQLTYVTINNGYIYELGLSPSHPNKSAITNTFNNLLSTFQFTK